MTPFGSTPPAMTTFGSVPPSMTPFGCTPPAMTTFGSSPTARSFGGGNIDSWAASGEPRNNPLGGTMPSLSRPMFGTTPPARLGDPTASAEGRRPGMPPGTPPISSAAAAAQSLDVSVDTAFEMLGLKAPVLKNASVDQGERFIQAISGEKKAIPGWSGQPGTMRSWLKLLAYWETETTVPKERWGLRLYQSFPEGSQPRKIADQVPMNDLLTVQGYGLVLSALLAKYRPYLEVAGPTSIDRFLYHGERAKGESFANYIAAKEVARQEMESHLQERLCERVAGRVLLRHANLTEFQREMMALKEQGQMWTFDQVITLLRPLDRPELLAQAAGAELGVQAAKHYTQS